METALLLLREENRTDSALLIFGENHPVIVQYLERKGLQVTELAYSREFRSFHVSDEDATYLMVIAGMGSASVEVVLSELSMLGVRNVVLTGSCGASYDHVLGSAKVLASARANNLGAVSYYVEDAAEVFAPDATLLEQAESLGLDTASMISSDAFYGYGCLLNEEKEPVFVGGRCPSEPRGYREFRDLYASGGSYLIDMEVAYVYALAGFFGMRAIAIKGVSNYVPFEVGNFISREEEAMDSCMSASLELLSMIREET